MFVTGGCTLLTAYNQFAGYAFGRSITRVKEKPINAWLAPSSRIFGTTKMCGREGTSSGSVEPREEDRGYPW